MKFRIKHAQQVVGFFLLASLVALIVVFIFMGTNQRWFARNYNFFTRFSSADGITTGMSVKLQGFEIGKVTAFDLNSSNRVRAIVSIYEDYYTKIRPDSVLEIQRSPIGVGGAALNLLPGKNTLPPMEENSFLPSNESALGLALIAKGLTDKPQDSGAIAGIINQVEPALQDIRTTAQAVTKLLGQVSGAVAGKPAGGELTTILAQIESTLVNLNQVITLTSEKKGEKEVKKKKKGKIKEN